MEATVIVCDVPACKRQMPKQTGLKLEERDYIGIGGVHLCRECAAAMSVFELMVDVILPRSVDGKVKGNQ